MRVEFLPAIAAAAGPAPAAPRPARRRLDRFEIGLLAVFGALSMWVVALDLWHAGRTRAWCGPAPTASSSSTRCSTWPGSSRPSHHLLISNLFVLRPTPADYFQPAIIVSGGDRRARRGAVAGAAAVEAGRRRRPLPGHAGRAPTAASPGRTDRRAALTLGLLFGSFSVVYGSFGIVGDMMPIWLSWGYPFGLMAVALIVFALLRYDRARSAGRLTWVPGLLGGLASTLHPWQGEMMILLVLGAELVRWRESRSRWRRAAAAPALPVLTLALTALPLALLPAARPPRHLLESGAGRQQARVPVLVDRHRRRPAGDPRRAGLPRAPDSFLELLLRLWPPAAVVIYVLSATALSATPLHAFNGITIPLVGAGRQGRAAHRAAPDPPRRGWWRGLRSLLAVVPANAYALAVAHKFVVPTRGNANFITHDERRRWPTWPRTPTPAGC